MANDAADRLLARDCAGAAWPMAAIDSAVLPPITGALAATESEPERAAGGRGLGVGVTTVAGGGGLGQGRAAVCRRAGGGGPTATAGGLSSRRNEARVAEIDIGRCRAAARGGPAVAAAPSHRAAKSAKTGRRARV